MKDCREIIITFNSNLYENCSFSIEELLITSAYNTDNDIRDKLNTIHTEMNVRNEYDVHVATGPPIIDESYKNAWIKLDDYISSLHDKTFNSKERDIYESLLLKMQSIEIHS